MRILLTALLCALAGQWWAAETPTTRMFALEPGSSATCEGPPGGAARPLAFPEAVDADQRAALAAGVFLTLQDTSGAGAWPENLGQKAAECRLARFEANDAVWTISAGGDGAPIRWIRRSGETAYLYLARGPALADALAWSRTARARPRRAGRPPTTSSPLRKTSIS